MSTHLNADDMGILTEALRALDHLYESRGIVFKGSVSTRDDVEFHIVMRYDKHVVTTTEPKPDVSDILPPKMADAMERERIENFGVTKEQYDAGQRHYVWHGEHANARSKRPPFHFLPREQQVKHIRAAMEEAKPRRDDDPPHEPVEPVEPVETVETVTRDQMVSGVMSLIEEEGLLDNVGDVQAMRERLHDSIHAILGQNDAPEPKPDPRLPKTLRERLLDLTDELDDIRQNADDIGWTAVVHKIEEGEGRITHAAEAAHQYETGDLTPKEV